MEDVRNLQLVQQRLDCQVLVAEVAVAEVNEPRWAGQFRSSLPEQLRDLITFKVLLRGEDLFHAVAVRLVHRQRRIPGGGAAEGLGVPQQQTERAPSRFAEAHQQPARTIAADGIGTLHQRQYGLQQVALLAQRRLLRMVGVPGQGGERGIDTNQAQPVVQVKPPNLLHDVAPAAAVAGFDGQHVQRCVRLAGRGRLVGQQHTNLRGTCLELGLDRMHGPARGVPAAVE